MNAPTPERAPREALERFAIDGQWLTAPDEASLNMRAELLAVKRHARKWLAVMDAQDAKPASNLGTAWRLLDEARADRDRLHNALSVIGQMIPAAGGASPEECRKISEVVWAVVHKRGGQPAPGEAERKLEIALAALRDIRDTYENDEGGPCGQGEARRALSEIAGDL